MEFFNTQPWVASPIIGVTAAMEQERANGAKNIDDAAISGVKVGLMGPLAGVGDPIFWGTLRPVLAALGAGLAITGNWIGPLLFFIGINLCRALTRWYGFKYGYEKGTEIVNDMGGGRLQKLTQGASILGLFVMGSLVSKWTTINISLELLRYKNQMGEEVITTVQSVLNDFSPGLGGIIAHVLLYVFAPQENQRHVYHLRAIRRRYRWLPFWYIGIIQRHIITARVFRRVPCYI